MTSLAGLPLADLEKELSFLPRYRAQQILKWINKGADNFDEMSNIPLTLKNELKEKFTIFSGTRSNCHNDKETKKIVISLKDETKIEAVLLNDGKNRYTACLSTQVGCPAACVFCKTGTLGFKRNLESQEIIEQFLYLKKLINNDKLNDEHTIDNIVVMGMGEPLLNLENLRKAISTFTDPKGFNLSRRRITVSTCGICEGLFDIAKNGPFIRLALSLLTADENLRSLLMPITKFNPLEKIKEALVLFQKNGGGRITLEIPLLGGINTRDADIKSIADFSLGLETVINLIPWNPVENLYFNGAPLLKPSKKEIDNFKNKLESKKLKVTKRLHKGQGINGACGQLGSV